MTLLHDNDRPELEDRVRAVLHRLAADVRERPPAWEDLLGRPDPTGARLGVVRSAGTSSTEDRGHRRARALRPRRGVATAAAGVILLALAGAVVVGRAGGEPTGNPATETIMAISPGEAAFDVSAAPAVWATGLDDPAAATMAYLAATGVPIDPAAPPALVLSTIGDTTAAVDWSLPGGPGSAGGTVYLRAADAAGPPPTWTVVGAAAPDVALADVGYDGSELSFRVAGSSPDAQLAVGVWVDGQPMSLGGDAVAQAGAGDVSLGELLDLGSVADAHKTLRLPVEPDDIVTLRVVDVVDGTVRALTQMAVALPDADPALAAAGRPPVDVGGDAAATTDVAGDGGVDGASGTAEGGTSGSGGGGLVPDAVVPTLPQLPALPALPTVPGVPVPVPPTPPATALGSITDHLP